MHSNTATWEIRSERFRVLDQSNALFQTHPQFMECDHGLNIHLFSLHLEELMGLNRVICIEPATIMHTSVRTDDNHQ